MDSHVQARLSCKIPGLNVPEYPFSLPVSAGTFELDSIVKSLLENKAEAEKFSFNFLANSTLLRVSIEEFIKEHNLSQEDVLTIECILREEAPELKDSLPTSDWVSVVQVTKNFILTGSYDNTLQIWSLKNLKQEAQIEGHTGPIKTVCTLSTDKNTTYFASGSQDQTIMFWKYDHNKQKAECVLVGRGHEHSVESMCSNGDGSKLASGSFDNLVKIWNTDPGTSDIMEHDETNAKKFKSSKANNKSIVRTPMVTLAGHREVVSGIVWTEPSEVISCSWDRNINLLDLETASQKSSLTSSVALTCLAHSPLNKMLITGSTDPHVRLWDPRIKASVCAQSIYSSHTGWVMSVDWSKTNENLFVSASYDKFVKLWDMRCYKAPLYDLSAHEDRALCCDWSNPGYVASGGVDNSVRLYSFAGKNN